MKSLFVSLLMAAAMVGCAPGNGANTRQPFSNAQSHAPIVPDTMQWPVESLDAIGGIRPQVLGQPQVMADPAAGNSLKFNGINDGLILPVVPLAGMKAFTLEVLFRPESGGRAEQRFIHCEDAAGNRMTVETRLMGGNWSLDTFLLAGASRRSLYDAAKLHPADAWYWVALRYDGTMMSDYVDGVKELEGPVAFGPMGKEGRISLGVRLNQVDWFKGEIKEVRFTPRAIAEAKLQPVRKTQPNS